MKSSVIILERCEASVEDGHNEWAHFTIRSLRIALTDAEIAVTVLAVRSIQIPIRC